MPLLLNFLKFAGGGLLRFAPVVLGVFSSVFGGLQKSKFVQKYGWYILPVLALVYFYYTREEKQLVEELGNEPTKKAVLLARYLGTLDSYSWYNPSTWSEDENAAYDLLMNSKDQLSQIEEQYNKISKSGSLTSDINRYLKVYMIEDIYGTSN